MKNVSPYAVVAAALSVAACTPAQQQTSQTLASSAPQTSAVQQAVNPRSVASSQPGGREGNGYVADSGLVNTLVSQLGVNSQQAMGGVGSIFSLAQQRMNPADFMQLRGSLPAMDQYLSAVPQPSSSNVLLGSAASVLGEQTGELGSLAVLAGSFQNLGMNANMIGQFVPLVLQYVQEQSGPAAMSLLQGALY